MKKKTTNNNSSDLLTKGYLNNALDKRFGAYDKKMDERFGAYDKKMDERFDNYEVRIDLKLDSFKREVEDSIQKGIDRVLTRIDPILAEVENAKIDRDLSTEQMEQVKRKVKDHEKRITKLENN